MLWVRVDTQYLSSGELPRYYVRFSLQNATGEAGSQHGAVCAAVRNDMVFQQSVGGQYGRPRCVYRDISEKSERLIKQGEQATNMYFPVGQNLCAGVQAYFYPPVPSGKFSLWQHRAIASASLRRLFAPLLQFEKREIHTVFLRFPNFELGQKSCLRLLAELRGAAL